MGTYRLLFITLLIVTGVVQTVFADQVIANSEDWRDVYSSVLYANLLDKKPNFLVSDKHSRILPNFISVNDPIEVFSSSEVPFIIGYESYLRTKDFSATEYVADNLNLEIASHLEDVRNFILVDDAYGYNAVSVAPYAVITNSYVLFVDRNNVREVERFLDGRDIDSLLIYGHLDRVARDRLERFGPEIINKDDDRFDNNIEIVKRYQQINPVKQIIISNGEFIEEEMMSGTEPVIFIGRNNVPEQVGAYLQDSDITVAVLIGNNLVGTATQIRRTYGVSTFVKFARSAREPTTAISPVEGLDLFYVPTANVLINISSFRYNRLTNQIEVTISNIGGLATYFKGTYSLRFDGGTETFGDIEPIFLESGLSKTLVYDVEQMFGDITGDAYVTFGESKRSLERVIDASFNVSIVEILDKSALNITKLFYDSRTRSFLVTIRNIGPVDAYVNVEIIDLIVDGFEGNYGIDDLGFIESGKSETFSIRVDLIDADIADNPFVKVRGYYGQREDALIKVVQNEFEFAYKGIDVMFIVLTVVIIILILLILLSLRKKKCEECGHKNAIRAKRCEECGHKF